MKKEIGGIIFVIFAFVALYVIDQNDKIFDYQNLSEDSLFMETLGDYQNTLNNAWAYSDNYCDFKVVDKDNNPLKGEVVDFYENGDLLARLTTNSEGIAGISMLESKDYSFKYQEQKVDINLKEESCNYLIIKDKELSIKRYNLPKYLVSEEQYDLNNNKNYFQYDYIFQLEDLLGEKLTISYDEGVTENKKFKRHYIFSLASAQILKLKISIPKNKDIYFENEDGKKTNTFKNGEGFYLVVNDGAKRNVTATVAITFMKDNKKYKITKYLNLDDSFIKETELDIFNSSKTRDFRLVKINENDTIEYINTYHSVVGDTIKETDLEPGIYKLTTLNEDNTESNQSYLFEIKNNRLMKIFYINN